MSKCLCLRGLVCFASILLLATRLYAQPIVDTSAYHPAAGVEVQQIGTRLIASWPSSNPLAGPDHQAAIETAGLTLELAPGKPLIAEMTDQLGPGPGIPILKDIDPVFLLTVGTRDLHLASGWVAFFDDPPKRAHHTYRVTRNTTHVKVFTEGNRTTVSLDGVEAGPFHGSLQFTIYPGTALVQMQIAVTTATDSCAILYDAGLSGPSASASPDQINDPKTSSPWTTTAYLDNHDRWHRLTVNAQERALPAAVRNRTIIAESIAGSVAMFPPPHQYFYPLDMVDNFGFTWHGTGYAGLVDGYSAGIRQPLEGDKRHVPWINAPPGTMQKLGIFFLLSRGRAETALQQCQAFTRADHFKHLDGYVTFTSHFHVEHTIAFLDAQDKQKTANVPTGFEEPGFVQMFKSTGVDIAHLAEFHFATLPGHRSRLAMLKVMHDECKRLSSDRFLLLPGEEPDVHLGGHWISLFPHPVYWTLDRAKDQPFVESIAGFGKVYHVGSSSDILKLAEAEHGLIWTAHPRIKGSFGFPDAYKNTDFYKSDRFLGAAWKAMPADNSLPRLGSRVLDLLDDMSNWGDHKIAIGEVDAFRISPDSELYGPMNINYLRLDKIPRFDQGWQPVLDCLLGGKLFVTTGEVLIPSCTIGGKTGGEILKHSIEAKPELVVNLEWTFPLSFAEVISGDGRQVFRQRIELNDTDAFGSRTLKIPVDLTGRKWARFEVWDIATNGAFAEPVWIE